MGKGWPKVIRDPVHNIIVFEENDLDLLLLSLINTREFQRLRRIRQLGFSGLVYPGATHHRFSHSIGVLHITRLILDHLVKVGVDIDGEMRSVVQVASLLHDIGHGPFSHAFEAVGKKKHEVWTEQIIGLGDTEVHDLLSKFTPIPDLPKKVRAFFYKEPSHERDEGAALAYIKQVVSSQLDADRFDYLLRDSHYTGTNYGAYDLAWLINTLVVTGTNELLAVGRKGIDAAQEYVFARYHMYRSVYYHKAVRSAEVMLKIMFSRLLEIGSSGKDELRNVLPSLPPSVESSLTGELTLQGYLDLDDFSVWELIRACSLSEEDSLRYLGLGMLNRKLLKCYEVERDKNPSYTAMRKFEEKAKAEIEKLGFNPELFLALDDPGDTPYRPFDFQVAQEAEGFHAQLREQIWVEQPEKPPVPIVEPCPAISALAKYRFERWYFPVEAREDVVKHSNLLYNR